MPQMTNQDRIFAASGAMYHHAASTESQEESAETQARDLITNLCHLAEDEGVTDVLGLITQAYRGYCIEREQDE